MTATYRLAAEKDVLSLFPARQLYCFDGADTDEDTLWMHARVRSDDYFMTIATELDQIVQSMTTGISASAVLPEIERLVSELLNVNKSYKIVPKA